MPCGWNLITKIFILSRTLLKKKMNWSSRPGVVAWKHPMTKLTLATQPTMLEQSSFRGHRQEEQCDRVNLGFYLPISDVHPPHSNWTLLASANKMWAESMCFNMSFPPSMRSAIFQNEALPSVEILDQRGPRANFSQHIIDMSGNTKILKLFIVTVCLSRYRQKSQLLW